MQDPTADEAKAGVMESGGAPSSSTMQEIPVDGSTPPLGESSSSSGLAQSTSFKKSAAVGPSMASKVGGWVGGCKLLR